MQGEKNEEQKRQKKECKERIINIKYLKVMNSLLGARERGSENKHNSLNSPVHMGTPISHSVSCQMKVMRFFVHELYFTSPWTM